MKDFQKHVFDKAIICYKTKTEMNGSAIVIEIIDGIYYLRGVLSIANIGNAKEGFYLNWCVSFSIGYGKNPEIVIFKKDRTEDQKSKMKDIANSVLDGVGVSINSKYFEEENLLMLFRPLTEIEKSFFV